MHKKRWIILLALAGVVIAGLLSRRAPGLPLWVGDALWALMIYLLVRLVFMKAMPLKVAAISLATCFIVEFSQLYQAPWINQIRATTLGHLVLGQGFLWSDLAAYTLGVITGFLLDKVAGTRYQD
jgi:hypothetical protein